MNEPFGLEVVTFVSDSELWLDEDLHSKLINGMRYVGLR